MSIRHGKWVLSIDPGKATGIALMSYHPSFDESPKLELSCEASEEEFAGRLSDFTGDDWSNLIVACEKFTITVQTAKNSQAPYSLEQIGVLKHICRESGYPVENIFFQSPADAKNMFPNDVLKKIGTWHKGGEGHANDAIRHGLLRMVKSGWQPKILLD